APTAAFMLLALIRSAREAASLHGGTNPTWTTPGTGPHRMVRTLGRWWLARVNEMAHELQRINHGVVPWSGKISTADARALPLARDRVALVLTSPPYCTRLDYVVSSSFELATLGIGRDFPEFGALRRASMGTPLAREGSPPQIPPEWPTSIRRL